MQRKNEIEKNLLRGQTCLVFWATIHHMRRYLLGRSTMSYAQASGPWPACTCT